jgi:glycosyltransferase involved in cell wall biosynthesis
VAPSLYEPFGLAVAEAARAARPLVLSDIPTFRELWGDAALTSRPAMPRRWPSRSTASPPIPN